MADISGSSSIGNAAANAHSGTDAKKDAERPAAMGEHFFVEGEGAPPPAPLKVTQVGLSKASRDGSVGRAHEIRTESVDVDDSATNRRSSITSDSGSSVETVLIGYPGVEGTRGLTRVSTTRVGFDDSAANRRSSITSDGESSVETVLIGYPGVDGTRGLTRVSTTRAGVENNDQNDTSSLKSDDDTLVEVSVGDVSEDDEIGDVRNLDFIDYRELDFDGGLRRREPLSYLDWHRETRGTPARFEEVTIPDIATEVDDAPNHSVLNNQDSDAAGIADLEAGDEGYVTERVRVINNSESEQTRNKAEREGKPGWIPSSEKDH